MGIFDFLLNSKTSIEISSLERDPTEPGFKSADWVIKDAFDKVMNSVECSQNTKQNLLESFTNAHQSGDPRAADNTVIQHLAGSGWVWHEFDQWAKEFSRRGKWPMMWNTYPSLYRQHSSAPTSSESAVEFFTVAELRDWLKNNSITSKPSPKSRADFARVFKERVAWKDFEEDSLQKHAEYLKQRDKERDKAKCKLLALTLTKTIYTLVHYYQGKTAAADTPKMWKWNVSVVGECLIEQEFSVKFDPATMKNLPPYFPGDRTSLDLRYISVKD